MALKAVVERDDTGMIDRINAQTERDIADDEEGDADDPAYCDRVRAAVVSEVEWEMVGAIDNMGGDERFSFSLDWLEHQTGLTRHSLVSAKHQLHKLGIVRWSGGNREDGGDTNRLT